LCSTTTPPNIKPAAPKPAVSANAQQTITYTASTTILSIYGEQFTVVEGDRFEGEMRNGKIVSGKIYDKSGQIKYTITPKPTLQYEH